MIYPRIQQCKIEYIVLTVVTFSALPFVSGITCSAGSYINGAVCSSCIGGKYSIITNATSCASCSNGTFNECVDSVINYACTLGCAFDIGSYDVPPWRNSGFPDATVRWIWNTAGANGSAATGNASFFKKVFIGPCHACFVSGNSATVTFYVMADNGATVTVNGVLVNTDMAGIWSGSGKTFNAIFNIGFNTISVVAINQNGPAGLAMAIYCQSSVLIDHTDSTWCVGASCTATIPKVNGVDVSSTISSLTAPDTGCTQCAAGKYASAIASSSCISCPMGKYSATVGTSTCAVCPTNKFTEYVGSTASTACKSTCQDYYFGSSSESSIAGYYDCSKPGDIRPGECQQCACLAGSYYNTYDDGYYVYEGCFYCSTGTYSNTSRAPVCTLCEAGKYVSVTGASMCTSCGAGKYSNLAGAAAPTLCLSCVVPNYCAMGSATQTPCPAGYYCPSPSNKTVCPLGGYCPINSTSVKLCPTGSQGNVTGLSNSSSCISCLPGTYSPTAGLTVCIACPVGKYTNTSKSINCQQCITPTCSIDQYVQNCSKEMDSKCISCNTTFKPLYSAWTDSGSSKYTCTWKCILNYFKLNSTACQKCKTQLSCAYNQYVTTCNSTADGLCLNCSNKPSNSLYTGVSQVYDVSGCIWSCNNGYYNAGTLTCNSCQAGQYAVDNSSTCTACQLGSFSPDSGSSICTICPTGSFSSALGSTVCTECLAGLYSPTPGSIECTSCPTGKYSATASASECTACNDTFYTPSTGASACTQCPLCSESGYFMSGCNGASPGSCEKCTNT